MDLDQPKYTVVVNHMYENVDVAYRDPLQASYLLPMTFHTFTFTKSIQRKFRRNFKRKT